MVWRRSRQCSQWRGGRKRSSFWSRCSHHAAILPLAQIAASQMRLLLDNSDYARTSIVSKKLSKKVPNPGAARRNLMDSNIQVLQDDSFEDVKIKFNEYMIRFLYTLRLQLFIAALCRYHDSKDNYMDMFRCYNGIYNTSIVKNDPEKLAPVAVTPLCHTADLLYCRFSKPPPHFWFLPHTTMNRTTSCTALRMTQTWKSFQATCNYTN